jgi:hypothetical protein
VLEARLVEHPEVEALYRALDVVYQLQDTELNADRRFELLRRWQQRLPDTLRHREVTALAWELVARDQLDQAVAMLEGQLQSSFSAEVAELL